jgi:hypothetical protein
MPLCSLRFDKRNVNVKYIMLIAVLSTFGTHAVEYDYKTEQLKGALRKGFVISCVPTITSQIERAGLAERISDTQKMLYCTCVGIKIYDDMTAQEVDFAIDKSELPDRKKLARKTYSEECADSELI